MSTQFWKWVLYLCLCTSHRRLLVRGCTSENHRLCLKCYGTCAETRFCVSAKWTSPFKSAGVSVQSTTGSRGVRISSSNARYAMLRGSVKGTGYPLHSPVSPSLPLPCVTVCHHISTGLPREQNSSVMINVVKLCSWIMLLSQIFSYIVCVCVCTYISKHNQ
jgi:hypothetical protein